jgi:methyltransferase (TIGR00027 family)
MKHEQASTTAKVIAAATLMLASDTRTRTRALVAPGAADVSRLMLSGTLADRLFAATVQFPPTRWLWRGVERITLPGIVPHFWRRKRWIERRCRQAIAEGFERVIVLGAGFDTLGLRLCAEFPRLAFVEIDHPATQKAKRRALANGAAPMPANFELVPLDLGGAPLPASVRDDRKPTFVIAEGLLMYLAPADIDRLFDALRDLPVARLRFLFSFITRWPDGSSGFHPRSRLIDRWLRWRGEPFKWSIEPQAIPEFLAGHRFGLVEMALTHALVDETPDPSVLDGENFVVCEPG